MNFYMQLLSLEIGYFIAVVAGALFVSVGTVFLIYYLIFKKNKTT